MDQFRHRRYYRYRPDDNVDYCVTQYLVAIASDLDYYYPTSTLMMAVEVTFQFLHRPHVEILRIAMMVRNAVHRANCWTQSNNLYCWN